MGIDVAGIGNALMDALAVVDDEALLAELGLNRGVMQMVDHDQWMAIYERVRRQQDPAFHSGGSCANSIATIGWLGGQARYFGQVGDDQMGHLYGRLLENACGGHALRFTRDAATGKVLAIISARDAERTMCTDLGAASQLADFAGFEEVLREAKVTHFEGYCLFTPAFRDAVIAAMTFVREAGRKVSIDACDPSVVRAQPELFWSLIDRYAHIVFLNEEEAERLTGHRDPEAALTAVVGRGEVEVAIVKLGARGSLVGTRAGLWRIPVKPVRAVDTTGAGDAYAGGFLYGWTRGWSPEACGRLASTVAGLTVAQVGAVVADRARMAAALAESR